MQGIFNSKVTVKRRLAIGVASRDALNNPIYGAPTATWNTIYTNMPARVAFTSKPIQFAPTGERILPIKILYIPPNFTVYHEDRILTADGIEYVVTSVVPGYTNNTVIDHWELALDLP